MLRKKKSSVEWLEFELFQDCPIRHGVFLRRRGISKSSFASLNVGDALGDSKREVSENKERIRQIINANKLIFVNQVHGKVIEEVPSERSYPDADALITKESYIGLSIRHADCQAAIFYDPQLHVLANVHAGWRGNVQNIYKSVIECFKVKFGSKVENILVGISPSLGPERAEFIDYKKELPEDFRRFQEFPNHFNLWAISKDQLMQNGILSNHIEVAQICTYSNPDDFFSYRRSKTTGRNATVAMLLSETI